MARTHLTTLSRSVEGKVAIITGAASGIGRACARVFSDEGATVIVADLGAGRAAGVAGEINDAGGTALGVECDVTDVGALPSLVDRTVGHFGGIDIVVNNAGIGPPAGATTEETEFQDVWRRTFAVNAEAQVRLVRYALPHLTAAGGGRVVNIASTEGIMATAGIIAYTASKHAVIGLTKSLAVELGRTGVTVNCVCPGPVRTAITAGIPEADKEIYAKRRVPLRRYADPEEIAHVVVSIALPASSFMNGSVVVVDGGLTVRH
jgi:3-oxoacyl-[acyl-carrier protein] reductase